MEKGCSGYCSGLFFLTCLPRLKGSVFESRRKSSVAYSHHACVFFVWVGFHLQKHASMVNWRIASGHEYEGESYLPYTCRQPKCGHIEDGWRRKAASTLNGSIPASRTNAEMCMQSTLISLLSFFYVLLYPNYDWMYIHNSMHKYLTVFCQSIHLVAPMEPK